MCTEGVCSRPSLPAYSELNLHFGPPSVMSGAIHGLFLPHLPALRGSVQTEAPERRAEQDSREMAQLTAPHTLSPLPKQHWECFLSNLRGKYTVVLGMPLLQQRSKTITLYVQRGRELLERFFRNLDQKLNTMRHSRFLATFFAVLCCVFITPDHSLYHSASFLSSRKAQGNSISPSAFQNSRMFLVSRRLTVPLLL